MIFQTADLVFEDRVSAYKNDILGLCKPHEVSERIAKYIAQNVEASGWQAVWRSSPKSSGQQQPFDVVVEVNLWIIIESLKKNASELLKIRIVGARSITEFAKTVVQHPGSTYPETNQPRKYNQVFISLILTLSLARHLC